MKMKILLCVFFYSMAISFAANGYITNQNGDSVSILDLTTNTITGYVNNGSFSIVHPVDVVITPDGTKAYVVSDTLNEVTVIDVATNTIVRKVNDTLFPFNAPVLAHIALPNNVFCYVTNEGGNSVSVIDIATDTVIQYLDNIGFPFALPVGIEVSLDGSIGLVVNFNGSYGQEVSIFSPAFQTVIGYVNPNGFLFGSPTYILVINDVKAYVSNAATNQVSIIDLTTFPLPQVIGFVDDTLFPFSRPGNLVVSNDQKTAYVMNDVPPFHISIVDVASDAVIGNIAGVFDDPIGFAITDDGKTAYVANAGNNTVGIIDLTTNTQTGLVNPSIFPFSTPYAIALVPSPIPPPPPFLGALPPIFLQGIKSSNEFLTQKDLINIIKWEAPINTIFPAYYQIFRNASLTDLAGTVLNTQPLEFLDHNRKKNSVTHYYVIAIYPNGSVSVPAQVTVTQAGNNLEESD